ncbi:MAG: L-seryl-tRNA(Sec) selenium transferase [Clostridiales bacterium]|nr:L-seryl-tRNA(Sec) selenium transferase [Clostridiales bacterium]
MTEYAGLPKVDKLTLLLAEEEEGPLCPALLTAAAREAVAVLRGLLEAGNIGQTGKEHLLEQGMALTRELYKRKNGPSLRRVINATGIVLHTNLGRAVLSQAAREAVNKVSAGYCNLEMDLKSGGRSSRYEHVRELLMLLTGAEDALVVNNNAAAVLLALDTLAAGGEAAVSRGELVEIGGSFRVPDIMAKSGVTLREVGCSNKTHLSDYEAAISDRTALLLKVHPSNFKQVGFTQTVELTDLLNLGKKYDLPVLYDLGGGCLYPLAKAGVGEEPQIAQIMKNGPDVLCFSGDKLLGGPQAGILLGKSGYISRMKANPLTRALRVDKFTLAALEATLREYLDMEAARKNIPTLSMILADIEVLRAKAEKLAALLEETGAGRLSIVMGLSEAGGGSLPAVELPGPLVQLQPLRLTAEALNRALRQGDPAVLAYIRENKLIFDPRTLSEEEIAPLAQAVKRAVLS